MADVSDRREFPVLKYRQDQTSEVTDVVVAEFNLTIQVNGREFVTLLCTPRSLENLVVGFLCSEGLVQSRKDLQELTVDTEQRLARVRLPKEAESRLSGDVRKTVPTAGGKGHTPLDTASVEALAGNLGGSVSLRPANVVKLMARFSRRSQLFLDTGGVHSCALSDGSEILVFEDDIGRHNALDKVLGQAMLEDVALEDKVVLTSGRVSTEILAKVARRGIPAIISRSAPTSAAIEQAKALGMTLIGFARGDSFNVYSNFECLAEIPAPGER